uniref:Uncharacterized protein n=1 Tax=Anopheles atroparvus TaxID=41427 RepID=A0A182ISI3_ANOAO
MPSEYEFSRDRLKFGRKLGEGEYGIVVHAQAENILVDEPLTTVAVKKLKHCKSEAVMRMLVSELKVMVEVGQHLNVVNFLGAVTQTIRKQDLMIIMEYCERGNLLDFIRNNNSNFVDCKDDMDGGWAAQQIEFSKRSRNESNAISFQTTDLIWWAAQIAYGMAYLASRNVLHGDLAARNVLLCERNVAKICDFGLARTMSRAACYKKKSNDPLPIKWLAIESLSEKLFSVKSDVWAYGVLLWELFALGTSPYPSIDVNDLYDLLQRGYRMDKPDYASEKIYDIMKSCWCCSRKLRPTFDALAETFDHMMSPDLRRLYTINGFLFHCICP